MYIGCTWIEFGFEIFVLGIVKAEWFVRGDVDRKTKIEMLSNLTHNIPRNNGVSDLYFFSFTYLANLTIQQQLLIFSICIQKTFT